MIKKILLIQLALMILVSSINLFALLFFKLFPDNLFLIAAENSSNFLLYYFSSFILLVNYFSGTWLIAPTLIFIFCYLYFFSKRKQFLDTSFCFSLSLLCFSLWILVVPKANSVLSLGLVTFYKSMMLSELYEFGIAFLLGIYSVWLIVRKPNLFLLKLLENMKYKLLQVFKKTKRTEKPNDFEKVKEANLDLNSIPSSEILPKTESEEFNVITLPTPASSNLVSLNVKNDLETQEKENEEGLEEEELEGEDEANEIEGIEENFDQEELLTDAEEDKNLEELFDELPSLADLLETRGIPARLRYTLESQELIKCISIPKNRPPAIIIDQDYFEKTIKCIEDKLIEFKIPGKIVNILKGPVVDTFELELGAGIKVSKVTSISEDLSLALCGIPIRMVYPMRGKSTLGIEVPRNPREVIYLDEILSSQVFEAAKQKLPLALGKNAFGEVLVADLTKMPHMLVAGSTGSGKSVFINTLLVSLLIKKPPKKMRLILIDPKQLELALYSSLEHLIFPVITDAKQASISLLWACQEMERRYSILKELGVRSVENFNEKIPFATTEVLSKIRKYYVGQEDDGFELPYIVIIIDEFADLIMGRMGKDIEISICRLAAKARASGIHLIIATQRPSVDVITGLIKSNFPTRISFRVTSSIDSRTILNSLGAEKLLGQGDMLYKYGIETLRLHSSYIGENEIEQLISRIAENGPCYNQLALDYMKSLMENEHQTLDGSSGETNYWETPDKSPLEENYQGNASPSLGQDELYNDAIRIVNEHKVASASMLQRRLKIGYNRAANLIDMMELNGIVGPAQGAKPREVLSSGNMLSDNTF